MDRDDDPFADLDEDKVSNFRAGTTIATTVLAVALWRAPFNYLGMIKLILRLLCMCRIQLGNIKFVICQSPAHLLLLVPSQLARFGLPRICNLF